MSQQTINVGTSPNDGTGTPLRTAFQYTNSNFSELYTAVGPSGNNIVVPGTATITGDLTVRTNKLAVTSSGVGIGTATPNASYILDLTTANDARARQWVADSSFIGSGNLANGFTIRTISGTTDGVRFLNYAQTTEFMRLDSSGNLGLGVAPSAPSGAYRNIQNNNAVMMGAAGDTTAYWNANAYYNAGWKYINSGVSSRYEQGSGHFWFTAPSGTAGNAITFTQAMTLDASGNLLVGTTSGSYKLTVNGTGYFASTLTLDGATRLAAAGSNALNFNTNSVDRVTIDSSGNSIITTTATAPALGTARQMVFNLTSDTNLRISVRGADGTTRTANITLA